MSIAPTPTSPQARFRDENLRADLNALERTITLVANVRMLYESMDGSLRFKPVANP